MLTRSGNPRLPVRLPRLGRWIRQQPGRHLRLSILRVRQRKRISCDLGCHGQLYRLERYRHHRVMGHGLLGFHHRGNVVAQQAWLDQTIRDGLDV